MLRLATASDTQALASMFARAFHDDPPMVWAHPEERNRARRAKAFFAGRLRTLLRHELTWTTDALDGGAMWAPGDAWMATLGETLRSLWSVSPRRLPLVLRGLGAVEGAHMTDPHLYLAVLGVDPARQRAGLGSRLLAPGLELCDREGVPAYLETGKAANVVFYERHGFRVTREMCLPRGPKVWLMIRRPR